MLETLEQQTSLEAERAAGRKAAQLILDEEPDAEGIVDPRTSPFAEGVIEQLAAALAATRGPFRRALTGAAAAAEDLNVEPFHGLIEVIQNADDLQAREVRFAFRTNGGNRQLLIVHNGAPVECHHVLPITLPYLTTKAENPDQKGRFGIGLKTLARISTGLTIHSAPYHFAAEKLSISRVSPEDAIADFYAPETDTLIVLTLTPNFLEDDFSSWFGAWRDDGLLFLNTVRRFRWCDVAGATLAEKSLSASEWEDANFKITHSEIASVRKRIVRSGANAWEVYAGEVRVPANLSRAHKAKSDLTRIVIAIPEVPAESGIFVAFKTRVPTTLAISIDAQFDPSTAREELIKNDWNAWLVERCADIVGNVASGLLATKPLSGWRVVPLSEESVGIPTEPWPFTAFADAFGRARTELADAASLRFGGQLVPINKTAYEHADLGGLLDTADVAKLAPECFPVPAEVRDASGRWRRILTELAVSQVVGTSALLQGFAQALFSNKTAAWWVDAARRLILGHPRKLDIFGSPCWRTADDRAVACSMRGNVGRPLVFGASASGFATRWKLFDQLHPAYGYLTIGEEVRDWLSKFAHYTTNPDARTELEAFAAAHRNSPVEISDSELRELRDEFDKLADREARVLGPRVGGVLLLDGYIHRAGKKPAIKVSPTDAYLPRSLDSEHPYWPIAAVGLPGINWLSPRYEEVLKTGATRARRKREDGTMSRGARKFLMLIGAECAPRLKPPLIQWLNSDLRHQEMRSLNANVVSGDQVSPDMERVLDALEKKPKKERRPRSAALIQALSQHWSRLYADHTRAQAGHHARVYTYPRGEVTAGWLCRLREKDWVAVGNGNLVRPGKAVVRWQQTEGVYATSEFVCNLQRSDIDEGVSDALGFIVYVLASDMVRTLERLRDENAKANHNDVLQIYRNLNKLCTKGMAGTRRVGDVREMELRQLFSAGRGLISVRPGEWRRPEEMFNGKDVFHQPSIFVPQGPHYADLWTLLDIRKPDLKSCIRHCKKLAETTYDAVTEAALIDVYRYMEPLLKESDNSKRGRLRSLPLMCSGKWVETRPVYFVEDRELRAAFAVALPGHGFWTPPCDVRDLVELMRALDLVPLNPSLRVTKDVRAAAAGEELRDRFRAGVDHLSNELARNDAATREKLTITWDDLRDFPLFVYERAFDVMASDLNLGAGEVRLRLKALLTSSPQELHVVEDAIPLRDHCGRAIASLFSADVQRGIEAEWSASWMASKAVSVEPMRFASDESHAEALATLAEQVTSVKGAGQIKVSTPASRASTAKPRMLKSSQGGVTAVEIHKGAPPNTGPGVAPRPLVSLPPAFTVPPGRANPAAAVLYSSADLEQRAWEILTPTLNTANAPELVDFRNRRGIGADGVIDWKTFVELKATGRSPQTSVELTNAEYERAIERGKDFILALVSGLEDGYQAEARLIIDPARTGTVRGVQGIRLVQLADTPAVVVRYAN